MKQDKWNAFIDFVWDRIGRRMHDDVTPAEVVTWLLSTWHDDPDRPSRDEVLRHCLECMLTPRRVQASSSSAPWRSCARMW